MSDLGTVTCLLTSIWSEAQCYTILFRGTLFHGYMASEVLGNTPYVFIKDEDLKYVARSHQLSKYNMRLIIY